ncbi:copper amine oxidase N-terminal domain-containing protein [Paenibacillus sp. SYP-B4298]|uniref:copper amine oxidase N-terminal domain-containing protein n=1 Tax=Paenibacillus sp. SYP-B4298 TaxID=2996034 RepID=UPI0022DE775E|nr:copper amine oxidase N-terminal domain-containing protein [Paenibacillus sp. SYP-B4298]
MNKVKKMMSVALTATVLLSGMGAALPKADAAVLIGGYPDKPHLLHFKTDVSLEVLYDARRIQFDVPPKMVEGSVLVPIRFVAEKMGGKLKLNGKDITITKGDKVLKLTRDSKKASFNGKAVTLAQPAMVDRGRTLVPLRAVSEGLGVNVEWDQPNQYVWIGSKDVPKIEDVIKPVDAKSYMKYYPKDDPVLTIYEVNSERFGEQKNTVRFIKTTDFPLDIGGRLVYRIDKSKGSDEKDFIRYSSNSKGEIPSGLFMPYSGKFKFLPSYTREVLPQATLEYVPVDYYDDDVVTKLKDINYIGINLGTDSLLLMKNEWR